MDKEIREYRRCSATMETRIFAHPDDIKDVPGFWNPTGNIIDTEQLKRERELADELIGLIENANFYDLSDYPARDRLITAIKTERGEV